jgi:hypothetical protein
MARNTGQTTRMMERAVLEAVHTDGVHIHLLFGNRSMAWNKATAIKEIAAHRVDLSGKTFVQLKNGSTIYVHTIHDMAEGVLHGRVMVDTSCLQHLKGGGDQISRENPAVENEQVVSHLPGFAYYNMADKVMCKCLSDPPSGWTVVRCVHGS